MPQSSESTRHKPYTKLSQRDIAGILQIDTKTLYNWRKHKPDLYRIVMLGLKFDEMLTISQKHYEELREIESQIASHITHSALGKQK